MKISVLTFVLRAILVVAIFVCGSCNTPFPSESSGPAGSGYVKWSIVSDLSRARLETDGRGEFVPGEQCRVYDPQDRFIAVYRYDGEGRRFTLEKMFLDPEELGTD